MTAAYLFEANLLRMCGDRRMTRVVRAVDQGVTLVPNCAIPTVEFLIFELADGDIRTQMAVGRHFDIAWALRTAHHVTAGLFQLHRNQVAHQDLKPSNVLTFQNASSSKIADLGRASVKGQSPGHEELQIPGDRGYAPPELLYGDVSTDWHARRQASDLYHLGSLIVFLFAGASMTPLLVAELPADKHWTRWGEPYSEVLPYIRHAFGEVMMNVAEEFPLDLKGDLSRIVRELCEPDPARRGHPKNHAARGNPYSVERYVAELNVLATRAESMLRRI
jgi:serine/threonine protein kinase